MIQNYKKHNLYVKSRVPSNNLLVWNVKDRWEPLCQFLNLPVPNEPIPHENRTGDEEYIKKMGYEHKIFKEALNNLIQFLIIFIFKIIFALVCYFHFYPQPKMYIIPLVVLANVYFTSNKNGLAYIAPFVVLLLFYCAGYYP